MSKSLGNLVFVDALRKEWDPRAIRLGDHRAPLPHRVGVGRRADAARRRRGSTRVAGAVGGDRRATRCSTTSAPRSTTTSTRPARCAAIDDAAARGADVDRRGRRCSASICRRPALGGRSATPFTRRRTRRRIRRDTGLRTWSAMTARAGSRQAPVRDRVVLGPSPRRLWNIDRQGFERLPDDGPAILCPNHISFLDSAFLMLTRAAQHQLRRQGRVHGLVEDEVPLPGAGHDPDRPLAAATRAQARARRRRAACCAGASCSASSPRAPAAATATCTRAAPAPPGWR